MASGAPQPSGDYETELDSSLQDASAPDIEELDATTSRHSIENDAIASQHSMENVVEEVSDVESVVLSSGEDEEDAMLQVDVLHPPFLRQSASRQVAICEIIFWNGPTGPRCRAAA